MKKDEDTVHAQKFLVTSQSTFQKFDLIFNNLIYLPKNMGPTFFDYVFNRITYF